MSSYISKLYKNAIKAEQEIVKAFINKDKPFNWYYGEYTENYQKYDCITDGHVLVAFGSDTFAISKEMFENHHMVLDNISQLIKKESSYEPAQLIGTKVLEGNKYNYCVLKKESTGEEIFFNEKYKKYFTDNVEYKVTDSKSPIKIYNGNLFMGIVMPIYDKRYCER